MQVLLQSLQEQARSKLNNKDLFRLRGIAKSGVTLNNTDDAEDYFQKSWQHMNKL